MCGATATGGVSGTKMGNIYFFISALESSRGVKKCQFQQKMQDKGDRNGVINHFVQFLQGHTYRRRQRQSHFFCKERGHAVLELNLCGSEQKSEEREKSFLLFVAKMP